MSTRSAARRRTAAQRAIEEDLSPEQIIQSEEEQEKEIEEIKATNAKNSKRQRTTIDYAVLCGFFVTLTSLYRYIKNDQPFSAFLVLVQTILLPFSLSSPPRLLEPGLPYHTQMTYVHYLVVVLALGTMLGGERWKFSDLARWTLPMIVATAKEIQRRDEEDIKERLSQFEGLRYDSKSA